MKPCTIYKISKELFKRTAEADISVWNFLAIARQPIELEICLIPLKSINSHSFDLKTTRHFWDWTFLGCGHELVGIKDLERRHRELRKNSRVNLFVFFNTLGKNPHFQSSCLTL